MYNLVQFSIIAKNSIMRKNALSNIALSLLATDY